MRGRVSPLRPPRKRRVASAGVMPRPARPTLIQLFLITTAGIALIVGGLFVVFVRSLRTSIVQRSRALRDAAAHDIGDRVDSQLGVASQAIDEVERSMRVSAVSVTDADGGGRAIEALLFTELLNHPTLSDITLVHGNRTG